MTSPEPKLEARDNDRRASPEDQVSRANRKTWRSSLFPLITTEEANNIDVASQTQETITPRKYLILKYSSSSESRTNFINAQVSHSNACTSYPWILCSLSWCRSVQRVCRANRKSVVAYKRQARLTLHQHRFDSEAGRFIAMLFQTLCNVSPYYGVHLP